MTVFRKYLSAPGLLSIIHKQFSKIPDPRKFTKNVAISIRRRDNPFLYLHREVKLSLYTINAYFASVTADFLRATPKQKKSFTLEPVMSSQQMELLHSTQNMGYLKSRGVDNSPSPSLKPALPKFGYSLPTHFYTRLNSFDLFSGSLVAT